MGFETQDVERKVLTILKVLGDSQKALGARVIARHLKDHGIELGERAVRYHLKLMDLAQVSMEQTARVALDKNPGNRILGIKLDNENGFLVYSVSLENGLDLRLDAGNGEILSTEKAQSDEKEEKEEKEGREDEDSSEEEEEERESTP